MQPGRAPSVDSGPNVGAPNVGNQGLGLCAMRHAASFFIISRCAAPLLIAAGLAACSAVDQVQTDMTRDWRKFQTEVLKQPSGETGKRESGKVQTARSAAPAKSAAQPASKTPVQNKAPNTQIAQLRQRAEDGEADAQFQFGLRYDKGEGIARDPEEALRWYRSAGEQGHALGALNAALLYDSGTAVDRDAVAAASWYRKAADAGNGRAAYNLGLLYENGDGVVQDKSQASAWYAKAQRAGISAAGPKLAALAPKPQPAIQPSELAPAAAVAAAPSESLRLALAKDYSLGASTPDDPLLADAIRQAADNGDSQAACNLGMRYVNGRGVPRDWPQGEAWLRRAAERGYAPAQTNLAMLLASDQNPQADNGEALMWASKAANAGYGPARAQLGMMYANGRGVAPDSRMADFWLASAQRDMREPPGSCAAPAMKDALTAR